MERLDAVIHRIDQLNAADPNLEMNEGRSEPAALLYGQRMSTILAEFASAPSEHLKIAVRGQHIERWKRPRSDYPEGRIGYLQWRRDAAKYHAERVAELMKSEGYDDDACARTASLIRKERLKIDREAQLLEDVAALVFMRWYFAPFAPGRPQEELFQIVKKTAIKMSAEGRKAALKLPLPAALVPAILSAD